ncbi:MAG: hypothetical protein ACUVQP_06880 [Bacteroidales bacterium]
MKYRLAELIRATIPALNVEGYSDETIIKAACAYYPETVEQIVTGNQEQGFLPALPIIGGAIAVAGKAGNVAKTIGNIGKSVVKTAGKVLGKAHGSVTIPIGKQPTTTSIPQIQPQPGPQTKGTPKWLIPAILGGGLLIFFLLKK